MKSLPWFRAYTEMVDDEKLRLLAFEDRWHFVALLCLKGQGLIDEGGPLLFRKVAVKLGIDTRTLDEVARRIAEVGLIDEVTLQPIAWNSRQMRSDKDITNAERQARYRDSLKDKKPVSNALRNVTVTRIDTDTDTDTDTKEDQKPLPAASLPATKKAALPETELQAVCRQTWAAYADSYEQKYGAAPVRNAKVSAQVKQFVQRVGQDESLSIAEWFVSHPGDFYAKNLHSFGLLLADAEKLRTQWATGRVMAPQPRKTQHQLNQAGVANAIFGYLDQPARNERMIAGEVVA